MGKENPAIKQLEDEIEKLIVKRNLPTTTPGERTEANLKILDFQEEYKKINDNKAYCPFALRQTK